MPEFQYDRKRFVEPASIRGLERATRRNAYDIDNKATQVPTDGGDTTTPTTPIGPGGTLITPPVIAGPDGYPIPLAIPGDDLASGSDWIIFDGTAYGWFVRSLVTTSAIGGLVVLNLDNTAQAFYFSGATTYGVSAHLTIRNGELWWGGRRWNGSTFVVPSNFTTLHTDGTAGVLSGTNFATALQGPGGAQLRHFQDSAFTYFAAPVTMTSQTLWRVCRIAHGATQVQVVSPALSTGTITAAYVLGVEGGVAWCLVDYSNGWGVHAVDLASQTLKVFNGGPIGFFSTAAAGTTAAVQRPFACTDGSLAYLYDDGSGVSGTYGLRLVRFDGTVVSQAALIPKALVTQSSTASRRPLPGGNAILLDSGSTADGAQVVVSPAGYQQVTIPATAGGAVLDNSVRWADRGWGTTLRWSTNLHLYEGDITS